MRTLQLLILAASVCGSSAWADTIELKTGERIEGSFKQATSAGAVIEVGGQPITIPLEKVKAIYFGAVVAANPTAASPAARDALDALRGLQSVVESGLTYRDYATRLLDTKVKVDRYLSSSLSASPELRKAIETAMREYELAGKAWNLQGNGMAWMSMITPDLVERCPTAGRIIPKDEKGLKALVTFEEWDAARNELRVDGQYAHHVLWKCAITEGSEAERLLAQH